MDYKLQLQPRLGTGAKIVRESGEWEVSMAMPVEKCQGNESTSRTFLSKIL